MAFWCALAVSGLEVLHGPTMVAGPINPTLANQMAFKGADGLTDAERKAYEVCRPLSCKHETCYKRYMYLPAKQSECTQLMNAWKACFAEQLSKARDDSVPGLFNASRNTVP